MNELNKLFLSMTAYYAGDPKRIQHFVKVHSFARFIGTQENLDSKTMFILECAALVHDIGIKPAEKKYGQCTGHLQEQEGPEQAQNMLQQLNFPSHIIDRVCYLVGHHHSYTHIDGLDYRILVEADFLVNLYEDQANPDAIRAAFNHIFRTASGRTLCQTMFGL